jgi:CheY-like chemotaxis protein
MTKKILLMEDEEIMINLLKKKLSKEGYEVLVAKDGDEGLKMLKEMKPKPDLILLDIIMPKLGGFEVMEEMKKDKELQDIPVIIISNSGQPVELERTKNLGAKDWVIKTDFDPQEVIIKVKKILT